MKKKSVIVCLTLGIFIQVLSAHTDLLRGLDSYSRSDWKQAIIFFESALQTMPAERTDVLYWLTMAHASAQNYQNALEYAELFLKDYASDQRAAEVEYQQGRILHLSGSYERSSEVLYRFIHTRPGHPKIPSAYYWIGENVYALGLYAQAREMFVTIVVEYPESGKVNEARQKIVMIDQQAVQDEPAEDTISDETAAQQAEDSVVHSTEPDPAAAGEPQIAESVHDDSRIQAVEAQLEDERKKNEELAARITALEAKIDELSVKLSQAASEKEAQVIREQLEKEREAQQRELLKQQEAAKRNKELRDLQQRARTLERMYEQRMRGGQ
ncbi:MAG: tetratricopeptide repeat protein [Treponema sp.]